MKTRSHLTITAVAILATAGLAAAADARWTEEKANEWFAKHGWLAGCNYGPASAINQLEMWQKDSFDPAGIDRELGWAESLGFNSVRVFLHNIAWKQDPEGFLSRVDQFLAIAERHHIGALLVIFDSCWDPFPKAGPQRAPKPHVHNSGWMQDPGREVIEDPAKFAALKPYVVALVSRFANDRRIHGWDVWNEPDNTNGSSYGPQEPKDKGAMVEKYLPQVFAWAREAKPLQPLTSGVWLGPWADDAKLRPMERIQIDHSDIVSFHSYDRVERLRECMKNLRRYNRPILCTEYMARPNGSTFDPHLAAMKAEGVAAYNWGFVSGKTQTIYPWDSWKKTYTSEPPVWFHDIFRTDGTPYIAAEVEYIRGVTGGKAR